MISSNDHGHMDKHHKSPIHACIAYAKGYAMHCHEMLFLVPGYTATTFLSCAPYRALLSMDESITDSGSEVLETLAAVHCLGQG